MTNSDSRTALAGHTPGPWSVGNRKPYVEVWAPMRNGSSPILASMESEPREANARLIAAAPDMLEALQLLVANIIDYERVNNLSPSPGRKYCWDSVECAVDAITKATGTQSSLENQEAPP